MPAKYSVNIREIRGQLSHMNYTTIELNHDSGLATITLNRPDKRNAISYDLIQDLLSALQEVANSSSQVLILTGAGKAFCSGMDLDNLKSLIGRTQEQSLEDSKTMASLFRAISDTSPENQPDLGWPSAIAMSSQFTEASGRNA